MWGQDTGTSGHAHQQTMCPLSGTLALGKGCWGNPVFLSVSPTCSIMKNRFVPFTSGKITCLERKMKPSEVKLERTREGAPYTQASAHTLTPKSTRMWEN